MTRLESIPLDTITVGPRVRRELGDINALAQSIADTGLILPIAVDEQLSLVAGYRRIAAYRLLGLTEIDAYVLDTSDDVFLRLKQERNENTQRKGFTPEEAVYMADALAPFERAAARERYRETVGRPSKDEQAEIAEKFSAISADPEERRSRKKIADSVGYSAPTLAKAAEVIAAAKANPETFQPLVDQMNRSGRVAGAHKELIKRQREIADAELAKSVHPSVDVRTGDFRAGLHESEYGTIHAIITDPPYPRSELDLYEHLAEWAARALRPGGVLVAMAGQSYLPQVMERLTKHLRYQWTLAYLTPGGQSVQLWERKVNTFWKPLIWLVNGDYDGPWIGDVCKSAVNDNDKRFHHWGQSETGMADVVSRFTSPGDLICDPFLGGATTGVVALGLKRRFIGMEIDEDVAASARGRMSREAANG